MIVFTQHISESLNKWVSETDYDQIFVLVDANTRKYCLPLLKNVVSNENVIEIPDGERNKNLNFAEFIWEQFILKNASRKSLLINLGGGMVSDIGGFCASVYQRGFDFVNIPTSLLAQVDASVGGKNGIDFKNLKNYIGTIVQPKMVFIDAAFLQTLDQSEILNGWGEIIKHAIISGGPLWDICQKMPQINETTLWEEIIEKNIQIKNNIVEEDPFESNIRKKLNLGHTIGHAIEALFIDGKTPIKHGFCVAEGILIESQIAANKNILIEHDLHLIQNRIRKFYSPIKLESNLYPEILNQIKLDKKNHHGSIRMAIPAAIGDVIFDVEISEIEIVNALNTYSIHANQIAG